MLIFGIESLSAKILFFHDIRKPKGGNSIIFSNIYLIMEKKCYLCKQIHKDITVFMVRLKNLYTRLSSFFRKTIWEYDSSQSMLDPRYRLKMFVKTFLLTLKTFSQKEIMVFCVPALTFYTLMSLTPLVAFLYVIAQGFGCDELIVSWVKTTLEAQPTVAQYIEDFVHNYLRKIKNGYILAIGIAIMLYSLHSLMENIEMAFDRIWNVPKRKLVKSLRDYTLLMIIFVVLVLLTSSISVLSFLSLEYVSWIKEFEVLNTIVIHAIAIVPMFVFFMIIFYSLPNTYVKVRYIVLPALLSSFGMALLQYIYFETQIWVASYNVIYGSLAALPLFLVWLQYSWTICLFCAVLSYVSQTVYHDEKHNDNE